MRPDTGAGFEIALRQLVLFLLGSGLLRDTSFGELSLKVTRIDLLDLLLLLFQGGGVEFPIGGGSGVVAFTGLSVLGLLGLLLFREALEEFGYFVDCGVCCACLKSVSAAVAGLSDRKSRSIPASFSAVVI